MCSSSFISVRRKVRRVAKASPPCQKLGVCLSSALPFLASLVALRATVGFLDAAELPSETLHVVGSDYAVSSLRSLQHMSILLTKKQCPVFWAGSIYDVIRNRPALASPHPTPYGAWQRQYYKPDPGGNPSVECPFQGPTVQHPGTSDLHLFYCPEVAVACLQTVDLRTLCITKKVDSQKVQDVGLWEPGQLPFSSIRRAIPHKSSSWPGQSGEWYSSGRHIAL